LTPDTDKCEDCPKMREPGSKDPSKCARPWGHNGENINRTLAIKLQRLNINAYGKWDEMNKDRLGQLASWPNLNVGQLLFYRCCEHSRRTNGGGEDWCTNCNQRRWKCTSCGVGGQYESENSADCSTGLQVSRKRGTSALDKRHDRVREMCCNCATTSTKVNHWKDYVASGCSKCKARDPDLLKQEEILLTQEEIKAWYKQQQRRSCLSCFGIFSSCVAPAGVIDGDTPSGVLFDAARSGNVRLVKALMEQRFNPCVQDEEGQTALHLAAEAGHVEVVREIVRQGGLDVIGVKTKNGSTARDAAEKKICEADPGRDYAPIVATRDELDRLAGELGVGTPV